LRKTSELLSYFGESISYTAIHYRVQKFSLCVQPYAGKLPDTIVVESAAWKPVLVQRNLFSISIIGSICLLLIIITTEIINI